MSILNAGENLAKALEDAEKAAHKMVEDRIDNCLTAEEKIESLSDLAVVYDQSQTQSSDKAKRIIFDMIFRAAHRRISAEAKKLISHTDETS